MSLSFLLAYLLLAGEQPMGAEAKRIKAVICIVMVAEELASLEEVQRVMDNEVSYFSIRDGVNLEGFRHRYRQLHDAPRICEGHRLLAAIGMNEKQLLEEIYFLRGCREVAESRLKIWHGYPCSAELYRTKLELDWWFFALDTLHSAIIWEAHRSRECLSSLRDWIGEEHFYNGTLIGEFK